MADTPLTQIPAETQCLANIEPNDQEREEKLPEYSQDGQLVPMTPAQNDRYSRVVLVSPRRHTIPRGLHTSLMLQEPPYLGPGWTSYVNPEGSPFYVNHDEHIITDDPIPMPEIFSKIIEWKQKLDAIVKAEYLNLPADYELYLTVSPDTGKCTYYYVDHTHQTTFWLEEIDPDRHDIELPLTCSDAQTKYILQEQYWIHCEYFPHRPVNVALKKELADIFRQARADHMTSDMSTFPYDAQQCKHYLEIIESNTESTLHTNWILARLWVPITRHRYHSFFGEDHARISREQRRLDNPRQKTSFVIKFCSVLLFNLPKNCADELDLLSCDDLTYVMHWREFSSELLRGWRESTYLSAGILLISTTSTLRPNNPASAALGSVAAISAIGSLVTGSVLSQWYSSAEKYSAGYVAYHLAAIQSPEYGYARIAQAYSLPRALLFWSMVFLATHMLSAVVDLVELIIQAPALLLAAVILVAFCQMQHTLRRAFPSMTK